MCIVNVRDILISHANLPDAGAKFYKIIVCAITSGDKVVADMDGVSSLPSIFLNVSLGKIIDEYDMDTLKQHVSFSNITRSQAERLKDYLIRYN
ncbi:STAS-like domain-containing protein [Prevotella multiformis]|uniref:DUF4325 domain-containing protein n=1 Tax=Prevotella multiformis DSM 16608 TaxID=888743 RepID=F0F6W4_9BACT|nr:STAS-like domain-containing protein [Prevotella multiformis]EGC20091.1 hypothetical protein HMPREF9141_1331 [Prevotella multiformis DSM 16608]QUB70164.1 STAS-like domain-containing protein [Prevotella multiformis]